MTFGYQAFDFLFGDRVVWSVKLPDLIPSTLVHRVKRRLNFPINPLRILGDPPNVTRVTNPNASFEILSSKGCLELFRVKPVSIVFLNWYDICVDDRIAPREKMPQFHYAEGKRK